jgi:hypothetical protein
MASAGRGANWVIKIVMPRSFTGADISYGAGIVTIPFATEGSARAAAAMVRIEVVPGEDHVIDGTGLIVEHDAGPGRVQAIANAADYGVP